MNDQERITRWGQIVANAWQDEAFKSRLLANPAAVLKEQGLETPTGVQVQVVENTDRLVYLTLPAKPLEGELSEAELAGVAGGGSIAKGVKDGMFWAMIFAGMMPTKTA